MNYRHAYHAGNFADVFKHAVLIELLQSFKAKSTPCCYIDTHAGRGSYDLVGDEALKTGEASDGILRLLELAQVPATLRTYVDLVRSFGDGDHACYPGSPLIASAMLRDTDSAMLCESQDGEAQLLRRLLRERKSFHVHHRDGYEALSALLPPREKRGLVLIDPPFEAQAGEFRLIEAALTQALTRWPTGRYAVWYPIKQRRDVQSFYRWLKQHAKGKGLIAEFLIHPDNSGLRLNGCGMAIINPPWQLENYLRELLAALREHLVSGDGGQLLQRC